MITLWFQVEYRVVMTARGSPTINVTYESMELSHLTAPYYRVGLSNLEHGFE